MEEDKRNGDWKIEMTVENTELAVKVIGNLTDVAAVEVIEGDGGGERGGGNDDDGGSGGGGNSGGVGGDAGGDEQRIESDCGKKAQGYRKKRKKKSDKRCVLVGTSCCRFYPQLMRCPCCHRFY